MMSFELRARNHPELRGRCEQPVLGFDDGDDGLPDRPAGPIRGGGEHRDVRTVRRNPRTGRMRDADAGGQSRNAPNHLLLLTDDAALALIAAPSGSVRCHPQPTVVRGGEAGASFAVKDTRGGRSRDRPIFSGGVPGKIFRRKNPEPRGKPATMDIQRCESNHRFHVETPGGNA